MDVELIGRMVPEPYAWWRRTVALAYTTTHARSLLSYSAAIVAFSWHGCDAYEDYINIETTISRVLHDLHVM